MNSKSSWSARLRVARFGLALAIVFGAVGLVACASEDPEAGEIDGPDLQEQGGAGSNCSGLGEPCTPGLGLTCCYQGPTVFSSYCRNLQNDPDNCGSCGNNCPNGCIGNVYFGCSAGQCTIAGTCNP
jgi:hypothetical protein